jgi:hypothetical protein
LLPSFTLRVWVWISSQNLYNTHPVRVNAFSAVSRSYQSRFLGNSKANNQRLIRLGRSAGILPSLEWASARTTSEGQDARGKSAHSMPSTRVIRNGVPFATFVILAKLVRVKAGSGNPVHCRTAYLDRAIGALTKTSPAQATCATSRPS